MDKLQFLQACERVINIEKQKNGIGTLGEKTLHAILKLYFEPDESNHEIKVGSYFADIINENGIIEIQTRQFNKLRKKLESFLSENKVTVVYPIARLKWLSWIDLETGEVTRKRKSPKLGRPCEIFSELYKIKYLLTNPNLRFCIIMLDIEELRYLDGWSQDKKRGSSRFDRVPTDLVEVINIDNINDYNKLIPNDLPDRFTSKDFKKASGLSMSVSQTALNVLNSLKLVDRIGKQGNMYIYVRTEK